MNNTNTPTATDNELIAEFMGLKLTIENIQYSDRVATHYYYEGDDREIDLQYHESWDWLMPVVEKIREKYGASDHDKAINTAVDHLRTPLLFTTIETTHQAVCRLHQMVQQR